MMPSIKHLTLLVIVPAFITSSIALFAPENILVLAPFLQRLLDFWMPLIPALNGLMQASPLSQITGAFFAVAWTLFPIQIVAVLSVTLIDFDKAMMIEKMRRSGNSRTKTLLVGLAGLAMVFASVFFIVSDPWFAGNLGMTKGRIGLAFLGSFHFIAMSLLIMMIVMILVKTKSGDY